MKAGLSHDDTVKQLNRQRWQVAFKPCLASVMSVSRLNQPALKQQMARVCSISYRNRANGIDVT